jgi:hypothetical protein
MDIQRLQELQEVENEGRGILCIRDILGALKRNNLITAQNIYQWEGDKIISYPQVQQWFEENFGCRLHLKKDCDRPICTSLREHTENRAKQGA